MGFWTAVEDVTHDAEIGLHLCPDVSPFAGEVINHLFISSPTMRDGLRRSNKYLRLLSDHLDAHLITEASAPHAMILATFGNKYTPRHSEIMICYGVLQAFRLATAGKFKPTRLVLHASDRANGTEFARIFACPVGFGAATTEIYFDAAMLDLPLLHADPDLASAQEAVVHRQMRRLTHRDTVDKVRRLLASELESGLCTSNWVAAELHYSPRRLRSELQEAGTSFNQLLEEVRQSLAKHLLSRTDESIENIAHLSGFANSNAFFRAFKKWTSHTPTQYRNIKMQSR